MARNKELVRKRNAEITAKYIELSKGRCAKWKTEEIIKELSLNYYLSERRIYHILTIKQI